VPSSNPQGGKQEETVPLPEHEGAVEDAAWRAINIYVHSISEATGSDVPDYIDSGAGEIVTFPGERSDRARIIANYAADWGIDFAEVSCTRRYMQISFDAIHERAAELAAENPDEVGKCPIAYTWEDEGWIWEDCDPKDPGAVGMYRCERKAKEPTDA
jgi:hypothetical protein